ncbi:hypothetical protein FRX31_011377 [Thalictrum thalictroides]|uniref:Uncharacterized protein n=1 Tax=Thalictrum thalictroides TaxID=46969 RepID=A0A7J6WNT0_THATH|nr:hypothetical protein FRX31_011377 [Thalictrum thalictroides]
MRQIQPIPHFFGTFSLFNLSYPFRIRIVGFRAAVSGVSGGGIASCTNNTNSNRGVESRSGDDDIIL